MLVVDKPRGPTSHDIVSKLRRIFGTRRIGHAGTLDPMATGVLVVLFGEATKLSSVLTRESKIYETVVEFGRTTDTLDADGKTTKKIELSPGWLDRAKLSSALEVELHRELQVPPQVSAIQVNGRRAYDVARAGETLDLAPRDVLVHGLELLDVGETSVRVRLRVSKGYYVRAFARDLGSSLGVPALLTELRRVASGAFHENEAVAWPPEASAPLISVTAAARRSLFTRALTPEGAERTRQGKLLRPEDGLGDWLAPDGASADALEPDNEDAVRAVLLDDQVLALVEPAELADHFVVRRGLLPTNAGPST